MGGQGLLPAVVVILVIAAGLVIVLIIVKSGCRLPHLGRSSTLDSPLMFNNEQSLPNLDEITPPAANTEEESPAVTMWRKYQQNQLGHVLYLEQSRRLMTILIAWPYVGGGLIPFDKAWS